VRVGADLDHFIVAHRTFGGSSQSRRSNSDDLLARAVVGAVVSHGEVIFVADDDNISSWSWRHSSADGSWCLRRTSNLHWARSRWSRNQGWRERDVKPVWTKSIKRDVDAEGVAVEAESTEASCRGAKAECTPELGTAEWQRHL